MTPLLRGGWPWWKNVRTPETERQFRGKALGTPFHGNVVNLRPKVGHGGDEVHRKVIVLIERHLLPA